MPTLYSMVNETGNRNRILEICKFRIWIRLGIMSTSPFSDVSPSLVWCSCASFLLNRSKRDSFHWTITRDSTYAAKQWLWQQYTLIRKNTHETVVVTHSRVNRFSKFFHRQISKQMYCMYEGRTDTVNHKILCTSYFGTFQHSFLQLKCTLIGPAFLQSSYSVVEGLLILLYQPSISHVDNVFSSKLSLRTGDLDPI